MNIKNILIPLIIAVLVSFTLPGLRIGSAFLGQGVLKFIGIVLLIYGIRNIQEILSVKKIFSIVLLIIILIVYKTLHIKKDDSHIILPFLSLAWLIIIVCFINTKEKLYYFVFFLSVLLFLNVLDSGIGNIFNTNRELVQVGKRDVITGLTDSYIIFCTVSIFTYFCFVSFALVTQNKLIKYIYSFGAITSFYATITSGSRGGAIVIIVGSLFFILIYLKTDKIIKLKKTRYHRKNNKFNYLLLLLVILFFITPWDSIYLSLTREGLNQGSTGIRYFLYYHSFQMFLEKPIFGYGWGATSYFYHFTTHSGWLQLLTELGIIGFMLQFFVFYYIYKFAKNDLDFFYSKRDKKMVIFSIGMYSILFSFIIWMFIENFSLAIGTRLLYVLVGIAISIHYIAIKENQVINIQHSNYSKIN